MIININPSSPLYIVYNNKQIGLIDSLYIDLTSGGLLVPFPKVKVNLNVYKNICPQEVINKMKRFRFLSINVIDPT